LGRAAFIYYHFGLKLTDFENTETLLRIPFSVIGRCSLVIILAAGKMHNNTCPQAASVKHFQCKNRCFRVFEVGYRYWYWKDVQN
jgi:hypothetical protein